MTRLGLSATALTFLLAGAGLASAQPRPDPGHPEPPRVEEQHGPAPHNWQRGQRIERNDWDRGSRVDYRQHHLSEPPRGYEWRQVDGSYVLAAVAGGVIADVILNAR